MRPRHVDMLITTAAVATVCALGADSTALAAIYRALASLLLAQGCGDVAPTGARRSA